MQICFLNLILALSAFYRTNDIHIQKPHGGGGGGGMRDRKGGGRLKQKLLQRFSVSNTNMDGKYEQSKSESAENAWAIIS